MLRRIASFLLSSYCVCALSLSVVSVFCFPFTAVGESVLTAVSQIDFQKSFPKHASFLNKLYKGQHVELFWLEDDRPNRRASMVARALSKASEHGLDPERYSSSEVTKLLRQKQAYEMARLEILLSVGLLSYLQDLRDGQRELQEVDRRLYASASDEKIDIDRLFTKALLTPNILGFVEKQTPQHAEYKALKELLKVSKGEKAETIRVNLERWRWLSQTLPSNRIEVNLASKQLTYYRKDKPFFRSDIVIGNEYHRIPVLESEIRLIEVNPYWNVPPRMAKDHYLPLLKKNPKTLRLESIRLYKGWGPGAQEVPSERVPWAKVKEDHMFKYRLRQDPGPHNKMGMFKFIFKNRNGAFMHGNPYLAFEEAASDLEPPRSIWIKDSKKLATLALGHFSGWSSERLSRVLRSEQHTLVDLDQRIPLLVLYMTASTNGENKVQFWPDEFERDEQLYKALYEKRVERTTSD